MGSDNAESQEPTMINAVEERTALISQRRMEAGLTGDSLKGSRIEADARIEAVNQLMGELTMVSPQSLEIENLKATLDFCQRRYAFEEERRKTIEQKASQILSQAGALITLSTLGLASVFDKIKPLFEISAFGTVGIIEFCLAITLVLGMVGLVVVVVSSMSNLAPKEYFFPEYAIALFDTKGKSSKVLIHSQVVYYLNCIKANDSVNSLKANRVKTSFAIFAVSLVFVVGSGVFMLIILLMFRAP